MASVEDDLRAEVEGLRTRLEAFAAEVKAATEWRDVREFGDEHTTFSNGARKMAMKVRSVVGMYGA